MPGQEARTLGNGETFCDNSKYQWQSFEVVVVNTQEGLRTVFCSHFYICVAAVYTFSILLFNM